MRMRWLICLLCLTMVFFLFSCGENDVSAPPSSKITLFLPNSEVTSAQTEDLQINTGYLTIAVFDENNKPIRNAKVSINYPNAEPQSFVVQFYDGQNPVDSPFDAHTDDFGVYTLMFQFLTGCFDPAAVPPSTGVCGENPPNLTNNIYLEYKASFEVRTGTNFASVEFSVKGPS